MSCFAGPNIISSGLVLHLDAANSRSYDSAENLFTNSNDFTTATWLVQEFSNSAAFTTSTIIAPDNTITGTKAYITTASSFYSIYRSATISSGTNYAYSIYFRPAEITQGSMTIYTTANNTINFNLSTNLITGSIIPDPNFTLVSSIITPVDNSWSRVSFNFRHNTSGLYQFKYNLNNNLIVNNGFYVWGAQLESNINAGPYYLTTNTIKLRSTTWSDLSTTSNNGTLVTGPGFSFANLGGLNFDGVDDHITFGSNPTLTDKITVEVWVKLSNPQGPNSQGLILGRESSYRLLYSFGSIDWVCATTNNAWYTTGTFITATSINPFTDTLHIVGTYDGTNNKLYINGTLRTTGENISGNILTNGNYFLARTIAGNIDYGQGIIYSHKIYNRPLSAAEIAQNFNSIRSRFGL